MEDVDAKAFLADKASDANALIGMLKEARREVVIPPTKNRKEQREYKRAQRSIMAPCQ